MRFRKLRIAWSVGCGVVCLLLVVMWVRSHAKFDAISRHSKKSMCCSLMSQHGHITFVKGYNPNGTPAGMHFSIGHKSLEPFVGSPSEPTLTGFLGLQWYSSHGVRAFRELIFAVPHWFALLFIAAGGLVPWLRWQFSLRTLLIAMTLVAVALWLIVWLSG